MEGGIFVFNPLSLVMMWSATVYSTYLLFILVICLYLL